MPVKETSLMRRKNRDQNPTEIPLPTKTSALDTNRERVLLKAAAFLPIGNDFLEGFTQEETLQLGLSLAIRRLVVIICNTESAPKDIIPAARLIFQLNGKDVGEGGSDEGLTKSESARITSELLAAVERTKKSVPSELRYCGKCNMRRYFVDNKCEICSLQSSAADPTTV
jgi:hypothetical protein